MPQSSSTMKHFYSVRLSFLCGKHALSFSKWCKKNHNNENLHSHQPEPIFHLWSTDWKYLKSCKQAGMFIRVLWYSDSKLSHQRKTISIQIVFAWTLSTFTNAGIQWMCVCRKMLFKNVFSLEKMVYLWLVKFSNFHSCSHNFFGDCWIVVGSKTFIKTWKNWIFADIYSQILNIFDFIRISSSTYP